ncbi:MAG: PEP-CTERM sorting domain-containing protein [Planctomycetia bacterium]|nr:PEP-CTERM sorting domain-containing protein [Planctomycetia bacterium]
MPQTPVYSQVPNPQLTFLPTTFVQTDQSTSFDLKTKSSLLSFAVGSKQIVGDPNYTGYALAGNVFQIAGTYSVWAPFGAGDMGAGSPASIAKVAMSSNYSLQVTGVNWHAYAGGSPLTRSITIVPSDVTVTGPQGSATNGTWTGTDAINWNDVRLAAGVGAGDAITEISLQFSTDIAAAGVYGSARTQVTNLNVTNAVQPVAVPEPPTVILAGLGAAAAVGHGYRRRKLRRDAAVNGLVDDQDEGAIALTA